jgi:hypothetical protein
MKNIHYTVIFSRHCTLSTLHYSTARLHYKDQSANIIYANYNYKNYKNPLHILWENYRVLSTKKVIHVTTNILSKGSRFPCVSIIAPLFHTHIHPHVDHSRMTYGWTLGTSLKPKLFRKSASITQKNLSLFSWSLKCVCNDTERQHVTCLKQLR